MHVIAGVMAISVVLPLLVRPPARPMKLGCQRNPEFVSKHRDFEFKLLLSTVKRGVHLGRGVFNRREPPGQLKQIDIILVISFAMQIANRF